MTQPNVTGPHVCTQADLPEVIALVDNAMRKGVVLQRIAVRDAMMRRGDEKVMLCG